MLVKIVGKENVLTKPEDIAPYKRDASAFEGETPIAVVLPSTAKEVSEILSLCNENNVPVYVRGGGSSLTGSSVPLGGIVISTKRFDKILELNITDRYVVVEPGVRLDDLNYYLSKYGYMYPPDPASSIAATVGGSISTNAGGLGGVAYGATKNWVMGLEVVLANGQITFFGGKTLKRSAGYDLASLMIGSEGTLGVITKAILRITRVPESKTRIVAYYRSEDELGAALKNLRDSDINITMMEFLDRESMESVKKTLGIEYPEGAEYMLMIDVSGSSDETKRMSSAALQIISGTSPITFRAASNKAEMDAFYSARKGLYSSTLLQRSSPSETVIIGDIVVPPTEVPATLKEIKEYIRSHGVHAVLFGHIGDGNIHMNIFADMANEQSKQSAFDLLRESGIIAVKHNGSVSAEHGIGMEKVDLLIEELKMKNASVNYELMKAIKNAFDPKNILNRGKLFGAR